MTYQITAPRTRVHGNMWLHQIFQCRAAETGGIIKRQLHDVEKEVGLGVLIHEVKRRNFRLLRTNAHVIIICDPGPIRVLV
ncbi:N-(5'-phosphoribosyl)anthranilate isomerase [Pseudooctadecabacter jejudonensis]|uniref:N-(5'-phosphoribosyl)anthranilate isomerase n=1 Tax=Pseudooctadecabacter jejudonensis TaxID=1391910 RepID=A0A1Y5RN25_9RHOB|nr:N-(5'-phosphoribosyl)anthranilate isomerase [Pseudooctadecabacter jejudonensis]SLN21346.1 hypothetical protein PSJ8397_00824 [Pseudooctadecabacter jejudonensis]